MRRASSILGLAVLALALLSCARTFNYVDPSTPRYANSRQAPADPEPAIRIVSFNIQYSRHIDEAIHLLQEDPQLRDADLVLLQEMDEVGTERIADALSFNYVYYPAVLHPTPKHDFGNAILSRWPIRDDRKIILPHLAMLRKSQRIATAGTVTIQGLPVRVYSLQLALPFLVSGKGRREQLETVLADTLGGPERVIIAGDLNSHGIGDVIARAGFSWPTEHLGATSHHLDLDHIFVKGFLPAGEPAAGAVHDNRGASDHRPVWTVVVPDTTKTGPDRGI